MKRSKFLFFALCLSLGLISACKEERTDIAVLIKSLSNPYWKTVQIGFEDTAKALNKKLYLQGQNTDDDAASQLNQCEAALLRKPKILIFSAVNNVNLLPCLKKAYDQKVLLVNLDASIDPAGTKKMGIEIPFTVASNNYDLGKKAAEFLNGKSGKVLILEGLAGNEASLMRKKGFTDNVDKNLTVIAALPANWDRLKAANITNDILTPHSDLSYIYAANDLMALGAIETLRTKGNTNIQVIGIDGTADAIKSIKEGKMAATIAQLPYLIAKEAVEKSVNYVDKGVRYDYNQYVPILTLDKKMLEENKEPLLKYVR